MAAFLQSAPGRWGKLCLRRRRRRLQPPQPPPAAASAPSGQVPARRAVRLHAGREAGGDRRVRHRGGAARGRHGEVVRRCCETRWLGAASTRRLADTRRPRGRQQKHGGACQLLQRKQRWQGCSCLQQSCSTQRPACATPAGSASLPLLLFFARSCHALARAARRPSRRRWTSGTAVSVLWQPAAAGCRWLLAPARRCGAARCRRASARRPLPPCPSLRAGPWHVVVGKAFAFEVTHEVSRRAISRVCRDIAPQCDRPAPPRPPTLCAAHPPAPLISVEQCKHLMHLFIGGTTAVLVWKH